MDQAERDHLQRELEIAANELLPGWIRRVELLQHDAPWMEPGQLMLRLVFTDPADRLRDSRFLPRHGTPRHHAEPHPAPPRCGTCTS